jgi:hypothetical protein
MDDALLQALTEGAEELPPDEALQGISELVKRRKYLAEKVAVFEAQVAEARSRLRDLDEIQIPEAMSAVGMAKFSLEDGTVVSVEPFVDASIREEDRPTAHRWLEEHGYGDLIKHQVSVSFAREEGDDARALVEDLEGRGLSVADKESVHPSTLKAFVREQMTKAAETGEPIVWPECIRVFQGRRAKLVAGK